MNPLARACISRTMLQIVPALLLATGLSLSHAGEPAKDMRTPESKPSLHQAVDRYEQLLSVAEALIKRGKPAAAYALLEPLEFEHAGEVRFDYLIGVAALDSGKPDKATFAFERVLAVNPDFGAARLDMARAYFQLGDLERAKIEFAAVLKQKPSGAAQANIQKYLDMIDARQEKRRTRVTAYVEGSAGHDSNVNYATSEQQIFVDRFSTIAILDPGSLRASDGYLSAAAGAEVEYALSAKWRVHAGGDVRKRNHGSHPQFNAINIDARAGITFETGAERVRVSALRGQYDLGGSRNSDTTGLKGEWQHAFSPANHLYAFTQHIQYRYSDVFMQPNDFNQLALGLGWRHVLATGKSALSLSAHYGTEDDVSPLITEASPTGGRSDGARRFWGMRFGGQTAFGDRTTLFASAGMQAGDYDKVNFFFQRQRNDRLHDLLIAANWDWNKSWTLRPQLSYTKNNSSIAIYDYDRMDVSLTVRREFR